MGKIHFASRVNDLKASFIREVLKSTVKGGAIPLAAGNPSPDAFPVQEVKEITGKILTDNPIVALQYGITEGYEPLREILRKKHQVKDDEDILITSGAQQGIDLSAKTFCNEGDAIICETPSFLGSLSAFRSSLLELSGVMLETDGMNIDQLEEKAKTGAKAIYVIPNFQNPTGITTSAEKRRKIYEIACKYNIFIIEDNPYGDLRYVGDEVPSIKSLDVDGRVVYCGSFSKTLSPGLRVGYVWAKKEIIQKMIILKQVIDVHTPVLSQMICNEFMRNYNFTQHILKLRDLYKKKLMLMLDRIAEDLPDTLKVNAPSGGLFVWGELPKGVDVIDFCKKSLENGAAIVPSIPFLVHGDENISAIRLNFSTPSDEGIIKGIEILKQITDNR